MSQPQQQPQQPQQEQQQQSIPMTLYQKLSESSHPIALLAFLIFRLSPVAIYLFGMLFTSNYILLFITVILLLAADFWNVKNISGRLLVGLRWWNESNELGQSIWVFENADPNRYINPIDSKLFWLLMYIIPIFWILLAIFAILKLELLSLILVIVAISLSLTNTMAYTKCDKFGKANSIANDMFSSVSGSLLSRINPLSFFTNGS
ncbi:Golgi apparatus membrane protein tvp23 [Pichia californica]|nr:Golgi apparatus membrane protein tvp23 [[Candida] californica]